MSDLLTCNCGDFIDKLCKCHNLNLCWNCHDIEYESKKELIK